MPIAPSPLSSGALSAAPPSSRLAPPRPAWLRRCGAPAARVGLRVLGAVALVLIWAAAATQFSAVQLPRPELVWQTLRENIWSAPGLSFEGLQGGYASNVLYTLLTALGAATAGSLLGFAVGIASARSQLVRNASAPFFVLLAAVPPLVAAPFMLIWFGPGQLAQSAIVAFFCFVVMGISAQNAASNLSPAYEEMAATLGASPRQRLWRIVVPASIPATILAVRVCLATGWSLQTAGELLGSNRGVGRIIGLSEQLGNTAGSIAVILLLAAAGLAVEMTIVAALRYVTRWQTRYP